MKSLYYYGVTYWLFTQGESGLNGIGGQRGEKGQPVISKYICKQTNNMGAFWDNTVKMEEYYVALLGITAVFSSFREHRGPLVTSVPLG